MTTNGAPPMSLEAHAVIAATLAEGPGSVVEVLTSVGFTEKQWNAATLYWMSKLAEDAQLHGAGAQLAIEYSTYFARAQGDLAPVVPMTPEEWARLTVDVQKEGSTGEPLARRNLSLPDYLRLLRDFTRRLSTDAEEQQRFFATYQQLQPATQPESGLVTR